ncbi:hypothetical protein CROQUDRAFT_658878 [Cronartium quercuum f. sp. fusiforme G11]|uniref:DH domain-containing protein n=1 Tax=Cronartium quercuum f. sp. fusiforme G11 TaxID=708437 RepID=A0A9P6TB50_9BASI|nr:hypothetical protein CROQUDRAFT_658878 [Cronartium quercuum f. sp. fusiforme G11]
MSASLIKTHSDLTILSSSDQLLISPFLDGQTLDLNQIKPSWSSTTIEPFHVTDPKPDSSVHRFGTRSDPSLELCSNLLNRPIFKDWAEIPTPTFSVIAATFTPENWQDEKSNQFGLKSSSFAQHIRNKDSIRIRQPPPPLPINSNPNKPSPPSSVFLLGDSSPELEPEPVTCEPPSWLDRDPYPTTNKEPTLSPLVCSSSSNSTSQQINLVKNKISPIKSLKHPLSNRISSDLIDHVQLPITQNKSPIRQTTNSEGVISPIQVSTTKNQVDRSKNVAQKPSEQPHQRSWSLSNPTINHSRVEENQSFKSQNEIENSTNVVTKSEQRKRKSLTVFHFLKSSIHSPIPISPSNLIKSNSITRIRRTRSQGNPIPKTSFIVNHHHENQMIKNNNNKNEPISKLLEIVDDLTFVESLRQRSIIGSKLQFLLILRELINSEKSYNSHLNSLLNAIKLNQLIKSQSMIHFEKKLISLIHLSNLLIKNLVRQDDHDHDHDDQKILNVGKSFLNLNHQFKSNFSEWLKLKLNKSILNQHQPFKILNQSRLNLNDILIMPIQRVTRYHLFLSELVKVSNNWNEDEIINQNLKLALFNSKSLAEYCNKIRS